MECAPVSKLPDGPDWIFEVKLDGYRAIGVKTSREARGLVISWVRFALRPPLLLQDRFKSKIIASYGALNPEAKGMMKGMALPGYFYIDASGIIREQYFEAKYTDRFTANNVLAKLFPGLAEGVSQKVDAPHLGVELEQSDRAVAPGSRFNLAVKMELPRDVHVYAPGVKGYKPIQLELQPSNAVELMSPAYPASRILYLEAIKEEVPVFEGNLSDAKINANPDFVKSLGPDGKTVTISGQLNYQACDKTICYPPTSVPLNWQLQSAVAGGDSAQVDTRGKA